MAARTDGAEAAPDASAPDAIALDGIAQDAIAPAHGVAGSRAAGSGQPQAGARSGESQASVAGVGDPPAPQLLLDNQLCFLFHRISRDLTAAYRPLLADLGLTYPQYLVMLVLWERDGLGVGEIGQRVCLDSGTLSPLLRRLERLGLVQRTRAADDERRVTVHLTESGRDLRERALEVPSRLAGHLTDDVGEYRALHARLRDLADRIEATLTR